MRPDSSFRVNTPTVSHEIIDGEAVIINLETGNYYSLRGVGAKIWDLVERRLSITDICQSVSDVYEGPRAEIDKSVLDLLSQLAAENLVVALDSTETITSPLSIATEAEKRPFESPELQKFTDMQELLLLDPVHDVDDTGWPKQVDTTS